MGRINNFPMTIELADSLSKKFEMVGRGKDPDSHEVELSVWGKIRKKKIGQPVLEKHIDGDWMQRETNMITTNTEKR